MCCNKSEEKNLLQVTSYQQWSEKETQDGDIALFKTLVKLYIIISCGEKMMLLTIIMVILFHFTLGMDTGRNSDICRNHNLWNGFYFGQCTLEVENLNN